MFHQALGGSDWFGPAPKRQATWARLIQILLTAQGQPCTSTDIRRYQAERLARSGGETLLAELMPLPAKNLASWYAETLNLPELRSRSEYKDAVRPDRIAHLKQRIAEKQPQVVVFYGARHKWPSLLGINFQRSGTCDRAVFGRTLLLAIRHPVARRARREEFEQVAELIAATST